MCIGICGRSTFGVARAQSGNTALILAARYGNADCTRALLDAGANKAAQTSSVRVQCAGRCLVFGEVVKCDSCTRHSLVCVSVCILILFCKFRAPVDSPRRKSAVISAVFLCLVLRLSVFACGNGFDGNDTIWRLGVDACLCDDDDGISFQNLCHLQFYFLIFHVR